MKNSIVTFIVCFLTHALWAQGNAAWKASSATGYYNDGANWSTDVMPTNAAVATLSATGSYTISAPAGGLVENSTLFMLPNNQPLSVTFDTTGTWWKKTAANYPADWQAFGLSPTASIGQHIFNMESMSTAAERNVFFISNAVWRFQCNSQAATNTFESGLFDFSYKGETNRTSANWMISGYGSPSIQRTLFKPGSRTIFDMLSIRGSAADQLTVFEGGLHEFYGRIAVKCDSPNAGVPDTLLLFTGTSSNLLYGGLQLCNATGNRGILRMEQTAYARLGYVDAGLATGSIGLLLVTNNAVAHNMGGDITLGAATRSRGDLVLAGNGYYRSTGYGVIKLAAGATSTGLLTVVENAQMSLENTQGITIGMHTNILAEMAVKDTAQVTVSGAAVIAVGASAATGSLTLANSALLNMPGSGNLNLGTAAGSVGVLSLKDNARLIRANANDIRIGTTSGATGIVTVADNSALTVQGTSGTVTLAGGNSAVGYLNITSTATVSIAGSLIICPNAYGYGEVNLSGNSRMDLGTNGTITIASSDNAMGALNLSGNATLYAGAVSKYLRHGYGNNARAFFNLNSGVFAATNTIFEPYAFYGEINLAGGESYVREYRFTGSGTVGTTNKLTVTGGRHVVGASGIGLGNGNNRVDVSLVTVSGGELISDQSGITLGVGTAVPAVAPIQKLTVSGGRFSVGANAVRVANSNPSFGRVELTGGELETAVIAGGAASLNQGGTGYSSFLANGGKIIFSAAGANRFENLDDAKIGANGLELVNSTLVTVNQAFTDVDGTPGTIVKSGTGILAASKTSSHASTLVSGGELKLGTGVSQFGQNLRLANGTSLTALDNVTLTTLTATSSVIRIAAGKKITATTASLSTVTLLTSGWEIGSYDLIEASNLTAENITVTGESATQIYAVSSNNGKITLTVTATPAPTTKTWQGAGSSWNTAENWNGGVPAKQDTALFNGATPTTITLDTASAVNTVQFNAASRYTLTGSTLTVLAGIDSVTGDHTIAAPIDVPYTTNVLAVSAQTGAKLTLSSALNESQSTTLAKTGAGTVKLTGANALSGAISLENGTLDIGSAQSFGPANSSASALLFKAGSLRYTGPEATVTKGLTFADSSTTVTNALILDIQSNLTLNAAIQNSRGAPIKAGVGNLLINFPAAGTYTLASARGRVSFNGNPLQMDGLPSTGYSGFTVVEGGITLKGTASMTANMPYQTVVGAKVRQTNLNVNAAMTIDGCNAYIGGSGEHLFVGYGITTGMPNKPEFTVINNGYVLVNALKTAGDVGAAVDVQINVLNRGFLDSNWAIQFGIGNSANGKTTVRMSNGVMRCTGTGELSFGGALDFVAGSGSAVTQTCTTGIIFRNNASGQMRMEGGSRLYYNQIRFENNGGVNASIQLDNAILQPNANNMTSRTVRATGLGLELLAGGVTVDMSSVARHVFNLPIRGTGGLIKTGAGELVFADGRTNNVIGPEITAQYTGLTEVRAGTLTVETNGVSNVTRVKVLNGATLNLSNAAITLGTIEGSGTITNGTLTATLKCTFTDGATQADAQPTLANVTTSGFKVDFGRSTGNPVNVANPKLAIAKITGSTIPDVSTWRGQNMGPSISATFSIENNTVYATFDFGGTRLIIR